MIALRNMLSEFLEDSSQRTILAATIHHHLANVTMRVKKSAAGIVVESISLGLRKQTGGRAGLKTDEPEMRKYTDQIRGFLNAQIKSLDKVPLDLSWCTEFQKKVLLTARRIPRGSVVTYGELAKNAGYPKAVRAAASVMRNNRFPLAIPCHRVIGKNGNIGGFMGATRGKPVLLKKRLLALEGVIATIKKVR